MSSRNTIRWVATVVVIIVMLGLSYFLFKWLKSNDPKAEGVEPPQFVVTAKYTTLQFEDYSVILETQGQVVPKRSTIIAAEIAGRMVSVSDQLEVGGVLTSGDRLVEIDASDYQAALSSSLAAVADAMLLLDQENARAQQATRDWAKLGRSGAPSDLVLRKPQLASAQARLSAAKASVIQAEKNLERTEVFVPYHSRVQRVMSNLGTYVTPGTPIAEVVSDGEVEVRLPMTLEDYGYLNSEGLDIDLSATIGGLRHQWKAKMVRSEGKVDRQTLTTMIVASVLPEETKERFALPPDGLFVQANWAGRTLKEVFVIPRLALHANNEVFLVGKEDKLVRRKVVVTRTEGNSVVISKGLSEGERLIISPLSTPVNGMKLHPVEERSENEEQTGKQL